MKIIDLFCGCGGLSKGFEQAGFEVAVGLDNWKDALITYKKNFPEAKAICADVSQICAKELLKQANLLASDIDVIVGGPPCQGFSLSGKRLADDPRNKLYKSFVDVVGYIQPKVFVMENVPGLVRLFDGKVKNNVIEDFTEIGYNVSMQLLSADDYGVPQQRKRVFFVGLHKDKIKKTKEFKFPIPLSSPKITCEEALSDLDFIGDNELLPEISEYNLPVKTNYQRQMRKESYKLLNHITTMHTEKTRSIVSLVPDGGNYKNLPKDLQKTRKVNIAWTRMNSKKPCFTIDTGHNHHFHYKANRVPTVRESARIQSFPDNFEFIGIKTSQLKQVGNAVPPILAQSLAECVAEAIEKG